MTTREEIVALDKALVWHPYTPMRKYIDEVDPVVVERAEGIYLHDKNGARLIDGNGSWWVSVLGHGHPRLVAALTRQAAAFAHTSLAGATHEPAVRLAEALLPRCGPSYTRVFYSDDGSTAVEVAVRMAVQYWRLRGRPRRNRLVSLSGAFHGETLGAASVSDAGVFHDALGPLLFDCIRLPAPALAGRWYDRAFAQTEEILRQRADEVAAVIVEPLVQGAAGMLMHPPEYLARLGALCRELDVLLVADEVFVGYGRTGSFLASHQAAIEPDIVCLAKGFSGGMLPMAATVTTDRVFSEFLGGPERTLWYGHSFTGNPLGAAVALEVLKVLDDERLIEGLPPKCEALRRGLDRVSGHPWVHDARRTGLIGAFTLAHPESGSANANYLDDAGWRFHAEARKRGALLRPLGNVIYFVLPLNVAAPQIDELFAIVQESLEAAFG
ncbi:MAG: adenosylmethionine--8-amino-7-oxononanoate transaminase [Deltaproteobacteria bacterium]|nr:adenosylmethionine--8-amino-7-oxononanoate transaminase [Deltaproteobacteria bacterium]